ncbi:MAG: hypothetical protein ABWK01_02130 [Infirmifilum sp.]
MGITVIDAEEARQLGAARISYRQLADLLRSGKAIIVPGSPQRVSKMRRRLEQLVGEKLTYFITVIGEGDNKERVYIIMRKRDLEGDSSG